MLVFAYDGSLHGDWVAHYAVRFAANGRDKQLRLVHVRDGADAAHVDEGIRRIDDECRLLGVALEAEIHGRASGAVAEQLLALAPAGRETLVVCGTRARPRNRAFLAGTVAARLLDARRFSAVAIRVVHAGVLGQPGRVLLPLAGNPKGPADAAVLLGMLGDDLDELHLLHVREVSRLRLQTLRPQALEQLAREGRSFLGRAEHALRASLALPSLELDSSLVVSNDVRREILMAAARHRARLIGLGASERTVPARLLSGDLIEGILRETTADVAVYRSVP